MEYGRVMKRVRTAAAKARTTSAVLSIVTLGSLAMATAGCGEDESPVATVTPAETVTSENQGALLRETVDELGLDVEWDSSQGGRVPADDQVGGTGGVVTDSDGTEVHFAIQLPSRGIGAPTDGPLVKGYLAEGQIKGGPSFSFWPRADENEIGRTDPDETESALIERMAEGLCMKFAGRECGDPVPWATTDI